VCARRESHDTEMGMSLISLYQRNPLPANVPQEYVSTSRLIVCFGGMAQLREHGTEIWKYLDEKHLEALEVRKLYLFRLFIRWSLVT